MKLSTPFSHDATLSYDIILRKYIHVVHISTPLTRDALLWNYKVILRKYIFTYSGYEQIYPWRHTVWLLSPRKRKTINTFGIKHAIYPVRYAVLWHYLQKIHTRVLDISTPFTRNVTLSYHEVILIRYLYMKLI